MGRMRVHLSINFYGPFSSSSSPMTPSPPNPILHPPSSSPLFLPLGDVTYVPSLRRSLHLGVDKKFERIATTRCKSFCVIS